MEIKTTECLNGMLLVQLILKKWKPDYLTLKSRKFLKSIQTSVFAFHFRLISTFDEFRVMLQIIEIGVWECVVYRIISDNDVVPKQNVQWANIFVVPT